MSNSYFLGAKSLTSMDKIVEAIDKTIAPRIAGIQPSTENPGTNREVSLKTMAFTTKINKPKVITVRGRVKKIRTGLIKVLITPSTIAAKR